MGGLQAIIFTKEAKRKPVASVANCPVCDLGCHFPERPDIPRTLYNAFWDEDGSLEEILKIHSPLYCVSQLPKIKYHIFHCDEDKAVNIDYHSKRFVTAMKESGHDITFNVVDGRGHCDLGEENWKKFWQCSVDAINGSNT